MNGQKKNVMPAERNNLAFTDTGANMPAGQKPADLENDLSARPSVQMSRVIQTENGCEATLVFRQAHEPEARKEIAMMLLDAFRHPACENHGFWTIFLHKKFHRAAG